MIKADIETYLASLILIRHMRAETGVAGSSDAEDPPLSAVGREEAAKLCERLKTRQIAKIYSSDLKRAYQTAQILADSLGVSLELRSQLRELRSASPQEREACEKTAADEVETIVSSHARSCVAIVAHSGTISAIVRYLLQFSPEIRYAPSLANGEMLVFRKDQAGSWRSVG